jgi:hypothetical protein
MAREVHRVKKQDGFLAFPTTVSGSFNLSAAVHSITLMRDLSFICLIQHWFSNIVNQCRYGWVVFDRTIQTDQDFRDTRHAGRISSAMCPSFLEFPAQVLGLLEVNNPPSGDNLELLSWCCFFVEPPQSRKALIMTFG